MQRARLILAPGKEKSLLRRHPWIFSGAIRTTQGHPREGDLVDVCAADGTWMAVGHYQDDSIMVKVIDFDTPDVDPTTYPSFWIERLRYAIDYRKQLGFFNFAHVSPTMSQDKALAFERSDVSEYRAVSSGVDGIDTSIPSAQRSVAGVSNAFRLINGEGDFMPGLIADYYNGVLVLQAHSEGMHKMFPLFCQWFAELLKPEVPLVSIFDKSSATLPSRKYNKDNTKEENGSNEFSNSNDKKSPNTHDLMDTYIWGESPEEWEMSEDGNRMIINFYEGQKTGSFLDQRENHRLVGSLTAGKRVLNTFGYTGGFTLAALRGGATYVETVDISKKALALCDRNVALNFPDAPHKSVTEDVLKYLDTVANNFDVIILDPPAFAKNHRTLQQGLKGYRNINQKAMETIRHGGLLFTFSCSQAVSHDDFQTMIFSAAALAHRKVRIVRALPHAADHPVSIYHPEGEYLKGLLLYVE
jgi:23S rRNA (cytosine1962-C5)-methyltransferase